MPGPFDDLAPLSSTYAAEDFMAQRKRLREARARWIEENECPTASVIEHTDKDGNVIGTRALGGPFQTGIRRYDDNIPAGAAPGQTGFKPSFLPAEQGSDAADLDKLDEIITEAETFMAPGIYRESPHPEIREGEDYGSYCARVGREYERAAGKDAIRRPVPDSDDLREPPAAHSSAERGTPAAGTGDRGEDRPHIRDNAESDHPGNAGERGSDTGPDAAGDDTAGQPGAAEPVSPG